MTDKQPDWLNKELYPFKSHYHDTGSGRLHYIDEGSGEPYVFVHSIPGWSFEFRKLIIHLRNKNRCIALDHAGFGLSDKHNSTNYSIEAHSERFTDFMNARFSDCGPVTLVVHGPGGPAAISYAVENPGRIARLVVINSWMWSLDPFGHFKKPSAMIRSWFGKQLYYRLNFSVSVILKQAFHDRTHLSEEVYSHYEIPSKPAGAKKAAHQMAVSLTAESSFFESLWQKREALQHIPIDIIWGMKDPLLPGDLLLAKWKQGFHHAKLHELPEAGHFPHEEQPDRVLSFLGA